MLNTRRFRLKASLSLFLVKMFIIRFSCYKGYVKWELGAVLNCFRILWSELEEKRMLYCKMRHIERQNDLCTKNANNRFLSKIREYWIDVRLRIVKLESGGQQLPVTKKNLSRNVFILVKSSFLFKVLKTYVFTQITKCSIVTHLHHPELKSRA